MKFLSDILVKAGLVVEGSTTVSVLAGTGTRMVVANSSGVLSTQAIPTGNAGTVTSVGLTSSTSGVTITNTPITSSGNINFEIATASGSQTGLLSSSDFTTFSNKQNTITLTTTGTSGAATLVGSTLNIPQYQSVITNPVTGLGVTNELTFWTSSTSIGNLSTATYPSLTELSYVKGVTSDIQSQINSKQATISLTTVGTSGAATLIGATLNIPQYQAALTNPVTGTGTFGQVAYFNGSTSITGSNGLVFDGTNLGIGLAAPAQKLTVNGDVSIATILNATTDTDKFLVSDGGIIKYRTGSEVLSDIGGQGSLTLTTTGTSGAATLVGNTLNVPQYGGGGGTARNELTYTATAGQTTFAATYIVGQVDVYYNGSKLAPAEFTATNGTSIVLAVACFANDIVNIVSYVASVVPGVSGTQNYVPKFTSSTVIGNSQIFDDGANVGVNTITPSYRLDVNGTGRFSGALTVTGSTTAASAIARGANFTPTLVAAANNDVLVGLDISPTFTNGAFTGVGNIGARIQSGTLLIGSTLLSTNSSAFPLQINGTLAGNVVGGIIRNSSTTGYSAFRLYNDQNTGARALEMGYSGSAYSGAIVSGGVAGESAYIITTGAYPLHLGSSNNSRFIIFGAGNIAINTAIDAGFKLDVNGTGRFQDNLLVSKNQNGVTSLTISNTTSGVSSGSVLFLTSDASSGTANIGKYSTTTTAYKIVASKDIYFYNGTTAGDIAILNDFATGTIKFAAGGSSTAQAVIKTTGQLQLNNYTSTSSFTGTAAGYLAFDSSGNILSAAVPSSSTVTFNRQTSSYTLALSDAGKMVEMNVASANNLTVPLNSSIAFPIGTQIDVTQYGAGQTTFVATAGVTIRSTNGWLKMNAQYGAATLVKVGTDEWYLFGNLNA